jgi:hypothetical protein
LNDHTDEDRVSFFPDRLKCLNRKSIATYDHSSKVITTRERLEEAILFKEKEEEKLTWSFKRKKEVY